MSAAATATAAAAPTLEYIPPFEEEFQQVLDMMGIAYNPDDADPIMVEKVVNPALEARFEALRKEIAAKRSKDGVDYSPRIRWPMFHGTTEHALPQIVRAGFDPTKNTTSYYGRGTYSAATFKEVHMYMRGDSAHYKFVIVCRVIEGKSRLGHQNEVIDTREWDATTNASGSYVCTPHRYGILPVYVVRYHEDYIPKELKAARYGRS